MKGGHRWREQPKKPQQCGFKGKVLPQWMVQAERAPSHGFTLNCLNTVSLSGCQSMCSKPTQWGRKRGSVQTYSKPAVFCGIAEEPGRPGPSSVPRKLAATTCLCLFVPHPAGGALACPGCFIQSACPHSGPSSAVAYFWQRFSFLRSAGVRPTSSFPAVITSLTCEGARGARWWRRLDSASRTRCSASPPVLVAQKQSPPPVCCQVTRRACFPRFLYKSDPFYLLIFFTLGISDVINDVNNYFLCFRWPRRLLCSTRVWQHWQHVWGESGWTTQKTQTRSRFLSAPYGSACCWDRIYYLSDHFLSQLDIPAAFSCCAVCSDSSDNK